MEWKTTFDRMLTLLASPIIHNTLVLLWGLGGGEETTELDLLSRRSPAKETSQNNASVHSSAGFPIQLFCLMFLVW